MSVVDAMRAHLAVLDPLRLDIEDDSQRHARHAAAGAGGHYRMTIVSPHFAGRSIMERHRLVYDALRPLMHGAIHALSITPRSPDDL